MPREDTPLHLNGTACPAPRLNAQGSMVARTVTLRHPVVNDADTAPLSRRKA